MRYVEVWRGMLKAVNANSKEENGQVLYPHMYGDNGWYSFTPEPYSQGALDVYYWSMADADLAYLPRSGWIDFLRGENSEYPVHALRREFETIRRKVEGIRQDNSTPDTRMSDDTLRYNPAANSCLAQLMLGGLTPRHGEPLHCRVRYFDPSGRRAGIPDDVASLVEQLSADEVVLQLVNTNPVEPRSLVLQAGAYAEHDLVAARLGDQTVPIGRPHVVVHLAPGAGARLTLETRRYVNPPTFAFPWDRDA